jgi:hypothetical protein
LIADAKKKAAEQAELEEDEFQNTIFTGVGSSFSAN